MTFPATGQPLPGFQSIQVYHQQLADGSVSCEQATRYYLDRIASFSHLNAFTHVYADDAMARARELYMAGRGSSLPLYGVIVAIKDVLSFKNHPLTAASGIIRNFEAVYNATVVDRLLQAGAIIIGSCNCDEFAMGSTNENSAYGPVLNALDNTRVPGGSSGGSAVAVQAGLCMVSLGSDTGGSVRQPADFCGVYGLKPTYGRVSRYGLIAYASSFDQVGIFGKSLLDVAVVLQAIAGADEKDATCAQIPVPLYANQAATIPEKKYRFAYLAPTLELPGLDPEIKDALLGLFDLLRSQGHEVTPVPFSLLDHIVPAYYVLTTAEASSNLGRYDGIRYGNQLTDVKISLTDFYEGNRSQGFGKEVQRRIMLGTFVLSAGYQDAFFKKAQQVRKLIFDQTSAIFGDFDAILMPVSPTTAFKLGEKMTDPVAMYLADIFTVFANLAGVPGMAIPRFTHSNGMPFGLQVLTNRFEEVSLLRISSLMSTII